MSDISIDQRMLRARAAHGKFSDPDRTEKGEPRARISLETLETLWFNTGTLCNIECVNCYIESSPVNDRLVYLTAADVAAFLDEIAELGLQTREIGFTGGEPFMNREILDMIRDVLARGYEALILTNAMQPMQRPRMREGLLELKARFGEKLTIRVSLDHYSRELHESERGRGSWRKTLDGLDWLSANGFQIAIAGRTCWNEDEDSERAGYTALIARKGWPVDAADRSQLLLFPEMDILTDVPEITQACWEILGVDSSEVMCATSRMVVKRKGAEKPAVLPCTLLPYDVRFEMGENIAQSMRAQGTMFENGAVKLCHPHCAKFCVLGGGNCSA